MGRSGGYDFGNTLLVACVVACPLTNRTKPENIKSSVIRRLERR
jgi:hypothetical protein